MEDDMIIIIIGEYIMEVTTQNFHQIRRLIEEKKLIQRSEYIGFDLEFTGVKFMNGERERSQAFMNEKYLKMAQVASKYNIIQCGLTFVIQEGDKMVGYPFNFFVFPRETGNTDPTISMQAGCCKFNSKQGMDWNKWIRGGINYVKITDKNRLLNPDKVRSFSDLYKALDQDNKQTLDKVLQLLEKFQDHEKKFQVIRHTSYIIRKCFEKYVEEKGLYFSSTYEIDEDQNQFVLIKKITKEEYQDLAQLKLEEILGFTLIFEKVWTSGKTFIGHNCLYDILFIYSSFVDELPNQYYNFKKIITQNRKFYDTKYIAGRVDETGNIFGKGTSLEDMEKFFKKQKIMDENSFSLAPGFEKYKQQTLHEAGYDSYLTMRIFLCLKHMSKDISEFQGRLNLNRSFFEMNLHTTHDSICQNMMIFAVPVASYFEYSHLDDLRRAKIQTTKKIRDYLNEQMPANSITLSEGLKQIFVSTRGMQLNRLLIIKMNEMKKKKVINVMSFHAFIKLKMELQHKNDT